MGEKGGKAAHLPHPPRGQVLVTWTNGAQVVLDDDDRDLHLLREFIARVETCTRRAA